MLTFKSFRNPLLIISDNPALSGGLSRMCRDLASLACTIPQFRVAVMGRGIGQMRKFPWLTYDYPESEQWGENYLQSVWEDFAGEESGVMLTLDDLSRRHWMVNPIGLPYHMQKFLGDGRNFKRWAYVPLDSMGPFGLPSATRDCALRFDRLLAPSEWGCTVFKLNGRRDADWLPHGIWMDKFKPYPRDIAGVKNCIGLSEGDIHVGCVMANQARKDFPAAFECFMELKREYGNRLRIWLHTDTLMGYWNVYALAADYGIGDCLETTGNLNDYQLAIRYGACDCTILPSAGEGFGYPIAESLACGTPCIVTGYAAGPELVEESCRVAPLAFRVDTQYNCRRAVLSGYAFAQLAKEQIAIKRADWEFRSQQLAASVSHLDWTKLKLPWEKWLLEGLK
jgi:glycosyltransferase involved in cell wall biosynthesis